MPVLDLCTCIYIVIDQLGHYVVDYLVNDVAIPLYMTEGKHAEDGFGATSGGL